MRDLVISCVVFSCVVIVLVSWVSFFGRGYMHSVAAQGLADLLKEHMNTSLGSCLFPMPRRWHVCQCTSWPGISVEGLSEANSQFNGGTLADHPAMLTGLRLDIQNTPVHTFKAIGLIIYSSVARFP